MMVTWLWRRNTCILVLIFLGMHWLLGLWIYPFISQAVREPKPTLLLLPHTQETVSKLASLHPRTRPMTDLSLKETLINMKGNSNSSETALDDQNQQKLMSSVADKNIITFNKSDNKRNRIETGKHVLFLPPKQQKRCGINTLTENGSCNNTETDVQQQMKIDINNTTDPIRKVGQLIYKSQVTDVSKAPRSWNGAKDGEGRTSSIIVKRLLENGIKSDIYNQTKLNEKEENIPTNPSYFISNEDNGNSTFESWKIVMNERKQRIREVCNQYEKTLKRFMNHKRLLFDTKHHIAYCRNAKAGTTSWLRDLLEGAGVSIDGMTTDEIHTVADRTFPPLPPKVAAEEMGHSALLFTVVRHPFTRLVSAYRDKIPEHYRKDVQLQMIDKYRDDTDYQLQTHERDIALQDPTIPTFREFALFVSDQILSCAPIVNSACLDLLDVHWRPYYDRCAPCDLHYDVIAKVETFHEDRKYIMQLSGLSAYLGTTKQSDSSHAHTSKGPSSVELAKSYFSKLTLAEQQRVFEAYFFDFQLFGYSPDIIK